MSQYTIELPEALVHDAHAVASAEHTSFDEFVRTAIAEKIAAARTAQYIRTRAARADPEAFQAVLTRMRQTAGPIVAGDALDGEEHGRHVPTPPHRRSVPPEAAGAAAGRQPATDRKSSPR